MQVEETHFPSHTVAKRLDNQREHEQLLRCEVGKVRKARKPRLARRIRLDVQKLSPADGHLLRPGGDGQPVVGDVVECRFRERLAGRRRRKGGGEVAFPRGKGAAVLVRERIAPFRERKCDGRALGILAGLGFAYGKVEAVRIVEQQVFDYRQGRSRIACELVANGQIPG